MIFFKKFIPVLSLALLLLLGSESVFAQGNSANSHSRLYGIGQPKSTKDLPPGQFRKNLESLPAKAKGRALGWLREFSFPEEDIAYLRVNSDGAIHYADTFLPSKADSAVTETLASAAAVEASQVFRLHSRPGAGNVVYLDFDGHTIEGAAWNNNNVLVALPFDPSENDSPATAANFTQDELNRIFEIWHRISEDFSAFNIDVTTEEPVVFTATTGHVLFTHDTDASGQAMPSQGAGGVAWINVFGRNDYATKFSPALVYYTNLYTNVHGYPTLNAEAGSHEFGHNIGLGHDGTSDGTAYYKGHGSGLVDWSPIMGNSYSRNVTQWSQGDYPNANNPEDDLAIIAGDLGHVGDDHGDSAAQATALLVEASGDILVSSPELDPDNVLPDNKGVIDDRNDVDWFYVDAGSGPLTITATPAWHSFTRFDLRGSNLDIELALYDSSLVQLDIDEPEDDSKATVSATVAEGRYYLQVDGVGNNTISNYDDYASMGMYFLEGNVQPVVIEVDNTPPSPAIMAWQTAPYATGTSSISMSAVQATDDSGPVEYYFSCVAGGNGCSDSGWQGNRTHSATGLAEGTSYSWKVRARDSLGNENEYSATLAASTELPPPPPDSAPGSLSANAVSASAIELAWLDHASNESSYEIQRSPDGDSWADLASTAANAESYTDSGLDSDTTYFYRVFACNSQGDSEPSNAAQAHTAYECSNSLQLAAKQWIVFSLPCDPAPLNKVRDLFAVLNTDDYNVTWAMWELDDNGETYSKLNPDSEITPGRAYWIYTYTPGRTITVNGKNILAGDIPLQAESGIGRTNFVGNTRNHSVALADILIIDEDNTPLSRPEADPLGKGRDSGMHECDLAPAGSKCLAHRVIRRWTGSNFDLYEAGTAGDTGSIGPFDGIWVDVYRPGARLRLPAASAAPGRTQHPEPGSNNGKTKKNARQPWHINLVAQSGKFMDSTNSFGRREGSEEGQDSHDLAEPRPIGNPYMSLLFANPAFAAVDWGYTSDFRGLSNRPDGEWHFVVKASPDVGQVTLRWTGDLVLFENARLRDEQTGQTVSLVPGGRYTFGMINGENQFTLLMQ